MKIKMTWFYAFDEKLGIEANQYLASISILLTALVGAIDGAGNTLSIWFHWDTDVSRLVVLGILIYIFGLNLTETIIASKNVKAAIVRTVVLLIAIFLAWFIGEILALVALCCIAAFALFCFIRIGLSIVFEDHSYTHYVDEFGFKHKLNKNILTGDYFDNWGNTYTEVERGKVMKV